MDCPMLLLLCLSLRGSGVLVLVTRVGGGRAGVCDFGAAVGLAFGDCGGSFFRQLGAGGLGRFGLLLGFFLLDRALAFAEGCGEERGSFGCVDGVLFDLGAGFGDRLGRCFGGLGDRVFDGCFNVALDFVLREHLVLGGLDLFAGCFGGGVGDCLDADFGGCGVVRLRHGVVGELDAAGLALAVAEAELREEVRVDVTKLGGGLGAGLGGSVGVIVVDSLAATSSA